MNKTACIFGSTGLIGNYLTEMLITDERYSTIILVNRTKQNNQHSKVKEVICDYTNLKEYQDQLRADEYYCCLGTTMKKAKTKPAFEYVDYQLPLEIGKLAVENKIKYLLVVSSIGASFRSRNFYLRTKGRMEDSLKSLGVDNLFIFRPSMLLGRRKETRIIESISKPLTVGFGIFFFGNLKKYKAIHGRTVAKAMVNAANKLSGTVILESDKIKEMAT